MADPRIEKLADLLVNYSVAVRPGDRVMIDGDTTAGPLLKSVYTKILQAGGHPLVMTQLAGPFTAAEQVQPGVPLLRQGPEPEQVNSAGVHGKRVGGNNGQYFPAAAVNGCLQAVSAGMASFNDGPHRTAGLRHDGRCPVLKPVLESAVV